MTKDDIIRMAREAGLRPIDEFAGAWVAYDAPIERFAALVAAAERKECAKLAEELWEDDATAFDCAVAIRKRGKA